MAQMVKNVLREMQETQVQSRGQKIPWRRELATQSSFPGDSDSKDSACNDVNTILFLEVHTSSIISVQLLFFLSK